MSDGTSVQVVVRLRPLNNVEKRKGTVPVVTCSTEKKEVTIVKGMGRNAARHNFHFDNVFGSFATQEEIFEQTLEPIVQDVLNGYESCVFAYGQTGTGKTYTMEGNIDHTDERGVIPRAALSIFEQLSDERYISFSAKVSYLEIYNEELSDLLTPVGTKSRIQICSSGKETVCMGLKQVNVSSAAEVLEIIRNAQEKRQVAETKMNQASSRSHCLFTLTIESTEKVTEGSIQRTGKLHLCDLAGSECAKAADGNQTRLRESMNINKSLLTLGRVINAVKNNAPRIPYRDSKLTRLLQDALGGSCKTCIIATVSPSYLCAEESLSTLHYADRAQGIKNKPINATVRMAMVTPGSPQAPRRSSTAGDDGGVDSLTFKEMEMKVQYMESQCEEAQAALGRKHLLLQTATDRAEALEAELAESRESQEAMQVELEESKAATQALEEQLLLQVREATRANHLLSSHRKTEETLNREAQELLRKLDQAVDQTNKRFEEVVAFRNDHEQKRNACNSFNENANRRLQEIRNEMKKIRHHGAESREVLQKHQSDTEEQLNQFFLFLKEATQKAKNISKESGKTVAMLLVSSKESETAEAQNMQTKYDEEYSTLKNQVDIDQNSLESTFRSITEKIMERSTQLKEFQESQLQSFDTTLEVLSGHSNDLGEAVNATWHLSDALLETHKQSLCKIEMDIGNLVQHMRETKGQLEKKQLTRLQDVKELEMRLFEAHKQDLSEHYQRVKESREALFEGNIEQKHALTLKLLEEQRTAAANFVNEYASDLTEALESSCKQQQTFVDQMGQSHTNNLVDTAAMLDEGISNAHSQINVQQSRMTEIAKAQRSGKSMEESHSQSLLGNASEVGRAMAGQHEALKQQNALLKDTLLVHTQGTLDLEHLAQLEKTKELIEQESTRQLEVAEQQRKQLESLRQLQQTMSQIVMENVMNGLQQVLSEQMTKLNSALEEKANGVESDVSKLEGLTLNLQGKYADAHKYSRTQVEKWGETSKLVGEKILEAANANITIDNTVEEFQGKFNERHDMLVQETKTMGNLNSKVGELTEEVYESNAVLQSTLTDVHGRANSQLDDLGSESREWVESNVHFLEAIKNAADYVGTAHKTQVTQFNGIQSTLGQAVDETKAWGAGNSSVIKKLEEEESMLNESRTTVEEDGKLVTSDLESIIAHENDLINDTIEVASQLDQAKEQLMEEKERNGTEISQRIGPEFEKLKLACADMGKLSETEVEKLRTNLNAGLAHEPEFSNSLEQNVQAGIAQTNTSCTFVEASAQRTRELIYNYCAKAETQKDEHVKEASEAIERNVQQVEAHETTVASNVQASQDAVHASSDDVKCLLNSQWEALQGRVVHGVEETDSTSDLLKQFCIDDFKMNQQAPNPEAMPAVTYSRELTTTPSEESLVRDLTFPSLEDVLPQKKGECEAAGSQNMSVNATSTERGVLGEVENLDPGSIDPIATVKSGIPRLVSARMKENKETL